MTGADEGTRWVRAMPWVFVLIWSTGFVVARLGMPHAPPFGFLAWRYAFSVLAFGVWIALARAAWPSDRAQWGHLAVTGVLMHAGYLGGVWSAVRQGLGAGTVALIVGLQPLLTALWVSRSGPAGRETVAGRQWLGLLFGLSGLVLVVWRKLGLGEVSAPNLALAVVALLSDHGRHAVPEASRPAVRPCVPPARCSSPWRSRSRCRWHCSSRLRSRCTAT